MLRYLSLIFTPSSRLRAALGLFGVLIAIGTCGYMLLSGLSLLDALYQTVTTITTVGFRELVPFGPAEKVFTIVLIVFGAGTALYALTLVVQEAVEGDVRGRFYARRERMQIDDLQGHYILCGFGRVGSEIARELRERGVAFCVIETRQDRVETARAYGYLVVEGDASEDRTLVRAGISRARCLLAASDNDAGNTFITLTARNANPHCFIVARAGYPQNEEKLRLAGANKVLSLYSLGGRRMVLSALQPLAADFMDTLAAGRHGEMILAEFEANGENGIAGQSCGQLLSHTRAATLLGVRKQNGAIIAGPPNDEIIEHGDIIIVMADETDIAHMSSGS